MRNYIIKFIMIVLFISASCGHSLHANDKNIFNIGIIIDGQWSKNTEYIAMIKSEILELTRNEFDVRFPQDKQFEGDWKIQRIKSAVENLLADKDVDLVLTLGVIASHEIATRKKLEKPVIAPFVLNPQIQGIPLQDGESGKKNLSYIHTPFTSLNTLKDFQHVVEFSTMTYLINTLYLETIPALGENIKSLCDQLGIKVHILEVEESIEAVLKNIPAETEAVYVSPVLHLKDSEYDHLIKTLKVRKLPSFSLLGTADVQRGFYTTNRPDIFPRVARRIALNTQRILIGDDPEEIPVRFDPGAQITINMQTAREINAYPKVDVLTEAELINQDQDELGMVLALEDAINTAIKSNLDISARKKYVLAGSENIGIARSPLLPQLDILGQGLIIDEDRAQSSFGSQPEKMVTGTLSATQLIYSEPVWANLSIQNSFQDVREDEYNQTELDLLLEAATAFFDVLRIQNIENIEKENLKRTKSNLEMARVREAAGSAGPAEVYRWESQLAQNRNVVIQVLASKNVARINLNRILNRKLDQSHLFNEHNLYTDELAKDNNVFKRYLSNLKTFDILPDFLVKEGMANSPELSALQNAINARDRALTSATNSFWAPTLAVQADYTNVFFRSGAGSEYQSFFPNQIQPDDQFWSVALNFSFPLFHGAERFAQRRQSNDELDQLQIEYNSVAQKIEQQIRSRIYIVGAAFAAIEQTRLASEAANKSLNVVQDSYAQGLVSILDLLDAQNTALIADELAATAVFDFILELMATERALGKFYLKMSDEEIEALQGRLEVYLAK